jgi:agmatinase
MNIVCSLGAAAACLALLLPLDTQAASVDMPEHVVGTEPYPFETDDTRVPEPPPIELPDSVAPKLALLSPEQVQFLASNDARSFAGALDKTVETLQEKTPEEILEWVKAMQWVVDQTNYVEGRDLPNIPLKTDSPKFNAWRLKRPPSLDPDREPGPISLGRS